ncbi:helix-turn-helix domain-containing protein [Streptomyces sp. NPDC008343]|uniref:helix-turn-helix domain-containing protein n=1 Tax=Streptomyces sp. NPDC008343 TaxID=3364828 RepID=UPI0036E233D6
MTQRGGGRGTRPWTNKVISEDVPPGRRAFAAALQRLARHLRTQSAAGNKAAHRPPTQKEAAERLKISESSLSRYLCGRYVPDFSIVKALHKQASTDAGGPGLVGITRGELTEMHERAEAERRCRRCASLSKMADLASVEADSLRRQLEEAESNRAGLQERLAALTRATPRPVPLQRRDRPRMSRDMAAARQVAQQAHDLRTRSDDGEGLALFLLRQATVEVLSPAEAALTLASLRELDQHQLADNLIHVYGRDQPDQDVLNIALTLHELGLPDDAGAILRAALK